MKEIIQESEDKLYGYELAIRNDISRIYLWVLRYWQKNASTPLLVNPSDQELQLQLAPALTYMFSNYDQHISGSYMADLCHLSYSYFSRSFHRLMHMTFVDYLNTIRIQEAEKLLISTSLNITEIATAVGFSTTSYFIKLFRKQKHLSPKQYRKKMGREII